MNYTFLPTTTTSGSGFPDTTTSSIYARFTICCGLTNQNTIYSAKIKSTQHLVSFGKK